MSTGSTSGSTTPTPDPHRIASWVFFTLFGLLIVVVILSASLGSEKATVINVALFMIAAFALFLLWAIPSDAFDIDWKEGLLGIILVATGIAIGSSPSLYPGFAVLWHKIPYVKNALPLGIPKQEYWSWDASTRLLKPTDKLPAEHDLMVVPPNSTAGIPVDATGYAVPADVKSVRVFVENRIDRRVSPAVTQVTE